jgi:gamma-glutamylcyclotransferase (GGCT)/AIG2-like uncharacterized protein YtfP
MSKLVIPRSDEPRFRVFVYGTLMRGEHNHSMLRGAHFVSEGRTEPVFQLRNLGAFPGLVPGGSTSVPGEVYWVDAPTLTALDRFEGHPEFYQRTAIVLADGTAVETYLLTPEQVRECCVIPSGCWRTNQMER